MRARAFTLIESLVAVTILAIGVVAVVGAVNTSRSHGAVIADSSEALGLAQQLIEEIIARPYDDPDGGSTRGPEVGETNRGEFDNADDYHGYTDTTAALASSDGTTIDFSNRRTYTRSVTVEYRTAPGSAAAAAGDFALVTVAVRDDEGKTAKLSHLLTRIKLKN